jgi:transcriptional regulator with XRE-family HTH domain
LKLALNVTALQEYLNKKGWSVIDLAKRMEISFVMVYQVIKGERNPGNYFIAGLLHACEDASFEQFFVLKNTRRKAI